MSIRFMKYYVTNGVVKAKVFYSKGKIYPDPALPGKECITLYAKGYDRKLGEVFPEAYENDTDSMVDYFDEGRVRIFPDSPLYAAALARVETNKT